MTASKIEPPESAIARAEALREEIARHNQLYFVHSAPVIPDTEFDMLVKDLEALEAKYPQLGVPDSPTQRVGESPSEGFRRVTHRVPMRSIDNTYNADELRAFDERVRKGLPEGEVPAYVVELKVDGVAMSLRYRDGTLETAVTRGDGVQGDDVTANVNATIAALPKRLKGRAPELLEVRGEVFMRHGELERLNREREKAGDAPLANPRNTTSGTLKLLDKAIVSQRHLDIFLYEVVANDLAGFETHWEALGKIKKYGLPVNDHHVRCSTIDEVIDVCMEWDTKRRELDYEIDGMVVKVDSAEQRARLGATSKSPRWLIAYKFPAAVGITKLTKITVQVGKSGALTPVAEMDPVQLAGTMVRRASLYNFEDLARKDLRVGDTVEVQKAGEIIPQVIRFVPEKRKGDAVPFPMPTHCPECKQAVHKDPDGAFLRCLNMACPAQVKERLVYYASRGAMDIDGMGPAVVEQLVREKLVSDPATLYDLKAEKLETLDRMGEKSAANLVEAVKKSKERPLHRLLSGLGIRHVGAHTAEVLATHYGTMDALMAASIEELSEIHEIGEVVATNVHDFFETPANKELIESLKKHEVRMDADKVSEDTPRPFAGKTFVVTGTLVRFTRAGIKQRIKDLGGRPSTSVSSKTDYLIAGEKAGSKLTKAQELGVPVLTEEEFEALTDTP
ncbi:MAG: NAD-dependent DNA ligase LigA [Candidatus Hydrogenedentes bacterium]|nr:NAD-dependent DNA ligase LigA [Candidatus Hydrogenedentota bacterium]